jgi:dCMP deaminase
MNAKWIRRFIDLAAHVAGWSKDPSSQVGAVIIRPDRSVASVGFNGLPRGVSDDTARLADRDQKLLYTVHAELNAILAAREPLHGCSIVVYPFQPCAACAAAIIQAGISEVICPKIPDSYTRPGDMSKASTRWADSFHAARTMFHEAGTVVRWF